MWHSIQTVGEGVLVSIFQPLLKEHAKALNTLPENLKKGLAIEIVTDEDGGSMMEVDGEGLDDWRFVMDDCTNQMTALAHTQISIEED